MARTTVLVSDIFSFYMVLRWFSRELQGWRMGVTGQSKVRKSDAQLSSLIEDGRTGSASCRATIPELQLRGKVHCERLLAQDSFRERSPFFLSAIQEQCSGEGRNARGVWNKSNAVIFKRFSKEILYRTLIGKIIKSDADLGSLHFLCLVENGSLAEESLNSPKKLRVL